MMSQQPPISPAVSQFISPERRRPSTLAPPDAAAAAQMMMRSPGPAQFQQQYQTTRTTVSGYPTRSISAEIPLSPSVLATTRVSGDPSQQQFYQSQFYQTGQQPQQQQFSQQQQQQFQQPQQFQQFQQFQQYPPQSQFADHQQEVYLEYPPEGMSSHDENGNQIRYVEVPVLEDRVIPVTVRQEVVREKYVPKYEVEYYDTIVHVPEIQYRDTHVDCPVVEDVIITKPVKQVIELKKDIFVEQKKIQNVIIEHEVQVPGPIYEMEKRYRVENRVPVQQVIDQQVPVLIAQIVQPVITGVTEESTMVPVTNYNPKFHVIDVPIARPIPSSMVKVGVLKEECQVVQIPPGQYNTLLRHLNRHLDNGEKSSLIPYVRDDQGSVLFSGEEFCPPGGPLAVPMPLLNSPLPAFAGAHINAPVVPGAGGPQQGVPSGYDGVYGSAARFQQQRQLQQQNLNLPFPAGGPGSPMTQQQQPPQSPMMGPGFGSTYPARGVSSGGFQQQQQDSARRRHHQQQHLAVPAPRQRQRQLSTSSSFYQPAPSRSGEEDVLNENHQRGSRNRRHSANGCAAPGPGRPSVVYDLPSPRRSQNVIQRDAAAGVFFNDRGSVTERFPTQQELNDARSRRYRRHVHHRRHHQSGQQQQDSASRCLCSPRDS